MGHPPNQLLHAMIVKLTNRVSTLEAFHVKELRAIEKDAERKKESEERKAVPPKEK